MDEYASNDIGYCSDCGVGLSGMRYGAGARQCWTCRQGGADVVEVPRLRQAQERGEVRNVPHSAATEPQEREPMKINDAFPSKYLKQGDLKGKRVLVTIDHVVVEDVGQGSDQEQKPVVYFRGAEKGWVLSARINADEITNIIGDDETEHWAGHKIVLYVDPNVMYGGKKVGGIRVAPPPQGQGKPSAPQPPPPEIVEGFQASDDDVPF